MTDQQLLVLSLLHLTNFSSAKVSALLPEPESAYSLFAERAVAEARAEAEVELARAEKAGLVFLTVLDAAYPERLRQIVSSPVALFVRGDVSLLGRNLSAAIVGTRKPSTYGATASRTLARSLAEKGFSIVSGLAFGVDSESHRGCLEGGGQTVAFLGNGLPGIYPSANAALAEEIVEKGGALVSERPLGASVEPRYLVARNRLQSGLSALTIVVETALSGGTPHTARFALAQGRPVFCPEPRAPRPENTGIYALLGKGSALPETMKAFDSAKKLCAALGDEPLARPIRREQLDQFLVEAERIAGS